LGRLAGISGRKAVAASSGQRRRPDRAAFRRVGYASVRQSGSHVVLERPGSLPLVIPMHRAVAPFLLRAQIRRAGLSEEEFLKLL
jgi:predicted RNA binding protein YcfA (HicA-like mRNA interferase family)